MGAPPVNQGQVHLKGVPFDANRLLSWQSCLRIFSLLCGFLAMSSEAQAEASVNHAPWHQLLQTYVVPAPNGHNTRVDYAGFLSERAKLTAYLQSLATVKKAEFARLSPAAQLAFLINAYNAWTVELILTAYPKLNSIKDLGSIFRSPWRRAFIPLLEETRSLDDIEHRLIRGEAGYREPRIHFAVNCASIGCPALRAEAYDEMRLESQLEDQTLDFLRDRSRNRLVENRLEVSPIFNWYRDDFEKDGSHFKRLEDFFIHYREALDLTAEQIQMLQLGTLRIAFTDYDWRLNQNPQPSIQARDASW